MIVQPELWKFGFGGSAILTFPLDVCLVFGGPLHVDFDEDGGCEAQERYLAWENADFDGSALELDSYREEI